MDYALIEKELELAHADLTIEEKLSRVARLLLKSFSFDRCSVYLARGAKGFVLAASEGEPATGEEPAEYGPDEGVASLLHRRGAEGVLVVRVDGQTARCETLGGAETTDPGLAGFGSAVVLPVRSAGTLRGCVHLKSTSSEIELTDEDRRTLTLAALQLAHIVRCSAMMENHRKEHAELLEIQEKLVNAEKLMTLGDMAAILAHEVKNPVISIGAYANRVRKLLDDDPSSCVEYMDHIAGEVRRVEKIMNGVIRFLRDNVVELDVGDANVILEEAMAVFAREAREQGVHVVKDLYEDPLPVLVDREQLKIAFDNLISNAIQSMARTPGRHTLKLFTTRTENTVVVKISDTGGGIDPDVLGYIFNPFFTTKERGTGLGLPITNSIVMRHKGMIDVDNAVGTGVTFTIRLPYASDKEAS